MRLLNSERTGLVPSESRFVSAFYSATQDLQTLNYLNTVSYLQSYPHGLQLSSPFVSPAEASRISNCHSHYRNSPKNDVFIDMAPKTWLVTGASSGLGTAIAEAALRAGNRVIATARNPAKAAKENPQMEELGGIWLELDVTSKNTPEKVKDAIQKSGGTIDVVVNNAGYSLLGSIEDMSEEEIENQFSTNVYGPVRVLKGVLPFMRAQRSGTIVNVSSIAGMDGLPSCAMYAGSKFALEGE